MVRKVKTVLREKCEQLLHFSRVVSEPLLIGQNLELMRAAVTALILASAVLTASHARAQSRVDVVPSVSVGSVYDDNLFAQVQGSGGQMLQVRPGLEATVESPRLKLGSLWTFDMQHSNHADLNTFDARRHADLDLAYRSTSATTLGFAARYDRTETPGEINLLSGILGDRRQAHRWEVYPNFSHRFRPRTSVTGSYDWTDESLLDNGTGRMHVARTGLSHEYTERTTFTASYMGRRFVDETDTNSSNAILGGWDYELAPGTRVTLQGGPRLSSYRGIAPEVVVGFFRDTNRLDVGVDYWHGETIVLGIQGPVAVNSGTARLTWPMSRTIEIGSHSAVTGIVTLDGRQVTTYRETLVSSWSPGGWYTVAASYGVDYQQGDIRRNLFSNANVLRHVFRVSVTVAPRLSRAIRSSDDPAARAKGVSQ